MRNLKVKGNIFMGTKAKTRGNGGHVIRDLRVIPGLEIERK